MNHSVKSLIMLDNLRTQLASVSFQDSLMQTIDFSLCVVSRKTCSGSQASFKRFSDLLTNVTFSGNGGSTQPIANNLINKLE